AMPNSALLCGRRHHGNIAQPTKCPFHGGQAGGVNAIVICKQNLHVGAVDFLLRSQFLPRSPFLLRSQFVRERGSFTISLPARADNEAKGSSSTASKSHTG